MKNYKKLFRGLSLVFATLLVFQLSACKKEDVPSLKEDEKMKGELSVYYVDYADQMIDNELTFSSTILIQELQNEYSDLTIIPTTFGSMEAFMTQVSTELNTGNGPDLFLMNYDATLNWNKMAKSGVYEDLTPYIKKDQSYHPKDYFESAIQAGQVEDRQYVLPLSFGFASLFSSKEKLEANGAKFDTVYSYEDIISALNNSIEKANQDNETIPLALSLDRWELLTCMMQSFGMPFIDYDNSVPALDKESLLELCNFLKKLFPYIENAYSNNYDNHTKTQNAKNIEYTFSNWAYVIEAAQLKTMMKTINQEMVTITLPKYDNVEQTAANVYHYVAVNSNSKNKQLAYDTTKALMDIAAGENIENQLPINRDNFNDWIEDLTQPHRINMMIDGGEVIVEDIDDIAIKVKDTVNGIDYVTLHNVDVMQIIDKGMMPYLQGSREFDECYEETVNKLNLYINE